MYGCMDVWMYVCMYVCMYGCMYGWMYVPRCDHLAIGRLRASQCTYGIFKPPLAPTANKWELSARQVVAPGTRLVGESRELVSIYFGEDSSTTAPPAYITSSSPGPWGATELTFYVTAFANNIVQFKPGTHDAFLTRTRIRFNS
jgi:hypothetical protein